MGLQLIKKKLNEFFHFLIFYLYIFKLLAHFELTIASTVTEQLHMILICGVLGCCLNTHHFPVGVS
jgi:hypothetical protein